MDTIYANKLGILVEIDKFLEIQKLSKMTQDKIHNLNRHIMCKEFELIITNLPTHKIPCLMCSLEKSMKQRRNNSTPSQTHPQEVQVEKKGKNRRKGNMPNSF